MYCKSNSNKEVLLSSFDSHGNSFANSEHSWPQGYKKKIIMLNSAKHEIFLINVEMPAIVGILTFLSRKNTILRLFESEKKPKFLIFLYL